MSVLTKRDILGCKRLIHPCRLFCVFQTVTIKRFLIHQDKLIHYQFHGTRALQTGLWCGTDSTFWLILTVLTWQRGSSGYGGNFLQVTAMFLRLAESRDSTETWSLGFSARNEGVSNSCSSNASVRGFAAGVLEPRIGARMVPLLVGVALQRGFHAISNCVETALLCLLEESNRYKMSNTHLKKSILQMDATMKVI